MPRTLSIALTPVLKFVLPPLWLAGVTYAAWMLVRHPDVVLGDYESGTVMVLRWFFLGLIGLSVVVIAAFAAPLKRVRLADEGLHISNYFREVTVPLTDIAAIQQNFLPTFRLITLRLRSKSSLGERIVFMPAVPRRLAFWRADYRREDEMVHELRSRAGLAEPRNAARIEGVERR